MAYGVSADGKLVMQFQKMCQMSANEDKTCMIQEASRNIVRFFWHSDPILRQYHLKSCEKKVFSKLAHQQKKNYIMVDGPHVEAYIAEMAHEITKIKKDNPKIRRNDGNVTVCKHLLEKRVRETIILIPGTI